MFKIIFITLLLIAFVAPLRRFLLWLFVGRQLVNQQKRYQEKHNPPQRKEGEVRVEYTPPTATESRYKGGQYVDYEEVKE